MIVPELHKQLLTMWFEEGVSSNDVETACRIADHVFAEDFQDGDSPGAPQNREQFKRMITGRVFPVFEDIEATVKHILAEGEMAAAYIRISMTHVGEFYGLPGTGTRVMFHETTISFMEDNRIKRTRGGSDWLGVLRQLGLGPQRPEREVRPIHREV